MGFGGEFGSEFGGGRAATADGTDDWVWNRGFEQLARPDRDWVAHATALGTADAAKWVNRQEYCSKQARKLVSRDLPAGSRWRPTLESARMRRSTGGRTISNSNAAPGQHSVSKRRPPRALIEASGSELAPAAHSRAAGGVSCPAGPSPSQPERAMLALWTLAPQAADSGLSGQAGWRQGPAVDVGSGQRPLAQVHWRLPRGPASSSGGSRKWYTKTEGLSVNEALAARCHCNWAFMTLAKFLLLSTAIAGRRLGALGRLIGAA